MQLSIISYECFESCTATFLTILLDGPPADRINATGEFSSLQSSVQASVCHFHEAMHFFPINGAPRAYYSFMLLSVFPIERSTSTLAFTSLKSRDVRCLVTEAEAQSPRILELAAESPEKVIRIPSQLLHFAPCCNPESTGNLSRKPRDSSRSRIFATRAHDRRTEACGS